MIKGDSDIRGLILEDEEKAFRLLFDRYYSSLCVIAYNYVKDPDQAEDIVQQLYIKVWEEKHFKKINISYKSYLQTGVRNACINFLEKLKTNENKTLVLPKAEEMGTSLDFLMNEEEYNVFEEAVAELPAQGRKAIELVYFAGKSYKNAAEKLDVSINTIKSHLKSSLRKLKDNPKLKLYYREKK